MNYNPTIDEFIICSAIHYKDSMWYENQPINIESGIVVCGRKHKNCLTTLKCLLGEYYNDKHAERENFGFLTNTNRYVTRGEAFKIAKTAGQLVHHLFDKDTDVNLNSEDIFGED